MYLVYYFAFYYLPRVVIRIKVYIFNQCVSIAKLINAKVVMIVVPTLAIRAKLDFIMIRQLTHAKIVMIFRGQLFVVLVLRRISVHNVIWVIDLHQ